MARGPDDDGGRHTGEQGDSSTRGKWHRDIWAEAIWESALPTKTKIVGLAYADHARSGQTAYVANKRAVARTGLSVSTVKRCRADLVAGGWLIEWTPARGHRATHYLLVIQGGHGEPPLGGRGGSVNPL